MKPIIHWVCAECEEQGMTEPPCEHFVESYKMHHPNYKHHEKKTKREIVRDHNNNRR